jgi:hypothetical protein
LAAGFGCSRAAEDESTTGQYGQEATMQQSILELSNNQVSWEGSPIGLAPTLTGDAAQKLAEKREAIPALVAALSDPDRFVAAHVLLTRLSGVEHSAFPAWNGLAVDLRADGTVDIDPAQRFTLARRWERWAKVSPHPKTLPPAGD